MYNSYLTVILKPTNACNMRCKHCYHSEKGYDNIVMDSSTYSHLLDITIPYIDNLKFIWHGGEPLLVGLPYLKKMIEVQKKYNHNECKLSNSIQTNASLLDQETIEYLIENEFDIGISYDGPYNYVLRDKTEIVEKNIELLGENNASFGVLTVITSKSIENIIDIYEYFKEKNIDFKFSYIFSSGEAKQNSELFIDVDTYVEQVSRFFNYWLHDIKCNIHVDNFENILSLIHYHGKRECEYSSCLFHYLSIDSNGNIYPCGRSYGPEYCLGNVHDYENILDVFKSREYQNLLIGSINRRDKCMSSCEYYDYCQGGCNNNAIMENGLENHGGYSCQTFKKLFYSISKILKDSENEEQDSLNPMYLSHIDFVRQ